MSAWTTEELAAVDKDDNLYISIPNADGTMHKPTWIWIVQSPQLVADKRTHANTAKFDCVVKI